MRSASTSPLDRAKAWAKEFAIREATDYDYDSLKEFVWEKMYEGGEPPGADYELYSKRIGEVCDAMKTIRVIVKFSDER